jgi:hypothetical protein
MDRNKKEWIEYVGEGEIQINSESYQKYYQSRSDYMYLYSQ